MQDEILLCDDKLLQMKIVKTSAGRYEETET